jgi:hypothetical protein
MKSELCSLSAAVSDPAKTVNRKTTMGLLGLGVLALSSSVALAQQDTKPLIPLPPPSVSTVPSNGDVNPYGVAFVPSHFRTGGMLNPGDILVSNFNNNQNLQGTGTTIVRVTPAGATSTFYQGKAGLGLTAALVALKHGLVFVGNMPTTDGTSNTVQAGSILVIDRNGQLDGTLTDPTLINGPWGMAIHEEGNQAQMFVSNVLSGTVVRFDLSFFENSDAVQVRQKLVIASGYQHRGDPAALELGPSGLAYDAANDILYVASSLEDAVYAIDNAGSLMSDGGTGKMIYQDNTHLHGPLDLVLAPNGHLIVANSDGMNVDPNQPSEIVEFTTDGQFVAQFSVDPNNGGAFGVNLVNVGGAVRFAAVDDNKNDLNMWTVPIQ